MAGSIVFRQQLNLIAAKAPSALGAPLQVYDLEVNPTENLEVVDWSNDQAGRFSLAPSASLVAIGMGSVGTASVLVIKPDLDIQVKITNGLGDSQLLTFKGGRTSVVHADLTGIHLTNPSSSLVLTGSYFLAGV